MFHSISYNKMLLIFVIIELITIFIGSVKANSLINNNGGSAASPLLSDLNHHQSNTNSQYSINKDEEQITKSSPPQQQIQMDENDALRILLQNYKLNADYQYNQQQYYQSIVNPWLRNNEEFIRPTANNRVMPTVAYIQPIFIPYPILMNPSQSYASPSITSPTNFVGDYEDVMSRANINRRGGVGGNNGIIDNGNFRNSPIYYVRLPPTPYAFLPSLAGYTSAHNSFSTTPFNPFIQYNAPIRSLPLSTYHNPPTLSSILNLPVNFLANGKPTNVYNLDTSSHEMPSITYQRPYQQSQQQYQKYPTNSKPIQTSFIRQPILDSKVTNLKRQYLFNGRPDDEIYLLPNEFDRWNTNYQNSIPEYY